MKIILAAGVLLAASAAASAQTVDVPKHKCEAAPQLPNRALMADKMVKRNFDQDLKAYKDCMNGYLDQRNAVIKANQEAANVAINEYNAAMKALNEQVETAKGNADKK